MLVVMIEGNVFAVKIPPHYKFVPSLSIVMQAEMAILNGKVIKSRFAHEKHEEVLALLLARYKAKEYKTVLISDVNTTHCHCLKRKELLIAFLIAILAVLLTCFYIKDGLARA